jgi:hypothetical protein
MTEQEKTQFVTGKSIYILVASGIVIPLLAIAMPYIVDYVRPETGLTYQYSGPVEINDKKAFEITVTNTGKTVEKTVEIWLPDKFSPNEAEIQADVNYKLRVEQNTSVVSIGDLRANETISLSFLIKKQLFFIHDFQMQQLKIRSTEHIASYGGLTEGWLFFYKASFWAAIFIFAVMIGIGVYQEYFMSPKLREQLILKELDKL